MSRPKTCATCAHRQGSLSFGKCARSGCHLDIERKYPTKCGENFEGWLQREPLFHRIALALWRRDNDSIPSQETKETP